MLNKASMVKGEWPLLGGLRFFLALAVLACHIVTVRGSGIPAMVWLCNCGGYPAVYCFFLVSGYSIAASLSRDTGQYYFRRAVRIFPTYWFGLVLALGLYYLCQVMPGMHVFPSFTGTDLAMQFIGLPLLCTLPLAAYGQSWSLGPEILYYIIAPVLNKVRPMWLVLTGITSYCADYWIHLCLARMPLVNHEVQRIDWTHTPNLWTAGSLAWIWIAGFIVSKYRNPYTSAAFLLLVTFGLWTDRLDEVHALYPAAALIIIFARSIKIPQVVASILTFGGEVSYPLYLTHGVVLVLSRAIWKSAPSQSWLQLIPTLAVATLVYVLWDKPIRERLTAALKKPARNDSPVELTAQPVLAD